MDRVTKQTQARYAIEDIMFAYGRAIDSGDLAALGALFAKGKLLLTEGREFSGAGEVSEFYRTLVQFYDTDGEPVEYRPLETTPLTQHRVFNRRYQFDNAVSVADVESTFATSQLIEGQLVEIALGRYEDRFARDLAGWHLVTRRIHIDLTGDMSRHMQG